MSKVYVALIADATASRTLAPERRARLQRALRAAIPEFNRRWRKARAARFAVTLGDEFQALLTTADPVWEIGHETRQTSAPEVDGPCFHAARAALEAAKRHRLLFTFGGFDPALTAFAQYYSALYWSWTSRQRRAATLLRLGTPAFAAAQLKVDRSAVSHLSRRMAWPLVEGGDKMFRAALGEAL